MTLVGRVLIWVLSIGVILQRTESPEPGEE